MTTTDRRGAIMKKQATLPVEALEDHIRDMRPGESGWTVPWAMDVDNERRCWLNPDYTIHHEPGGTVQMRVERHRDGYHVSLVRDYRYSTYAPPKGFLPVTAFLQEEESP